MLEPETRPLPNSVEVERDALRVLVKLDNRYAAHSGGDRPVATRPGHMAIHSAGIPAPYASAGDYRVIYTVDTVGSWVVCGRFSVTAAKIYEPVT